MKKLSDSPDGTAEDEYNFFQKEDIDERKPVDIITARATPIKSNALAKKNLSTVRKSDIKSPCSVQNQKFEL